MKKQLHPQRFLSIIQLQDGTFLRKRWLYFRDYLRVEIDTSSNKIWTEDTLSTMQTTLKVVNKKNQNNKEAHN